MIQDYKKISFIDALILIYVAGSYVFSLVEKYVIVFRAITLLLIVSLLYYVVKKRNSKLQIDSFIKFAIAFLLFGFISILWAKNSSYTINKIITISEILVLIILLYNYITYENKKDYLIFCNATAGTVYSIYILAFYGVGKYIRLLQNSERIGSEIANVNTIGVILAFSCIIYLWYILYLKKYIMIIPFALNLIVSVGTGSKKVILCLVVGIFLFVILKAQTRKQVIIGIIEVVIVAFVLYYASQLSLFAAINGRFGRFFAALTGRGRADGSSLARLDYIRIGFIEFFKRPLWGVGLGNSKWITAQYVGKETYLHCNYVELLSTLGIIGFVLYYAMYFIPVKNYFKYGIRGNSYHILGLVMIILRLIMHIAAVTYYDKFEYMNLMLSMCLISPMITKPQANVDSLE